MSRLTPDVGRIVVVPHYAFPDEDGAGVCVRAHCPDTRLSDYYWRLTDWTSRPPRAGGAPDVPPMYPAEAWPRSWIPEPCHPEHREVWVADESGEVSRIIAEVRGREMGRRPPTSSSPTSA